ncbi:hypothetical protein B0H14DRAFT_2894751, partial [Mycena olivaceomarginata]
MKMQQSQQAPICSGLKYTHSAYIKITPASLQVCFRFGGYPYGASSSRKTYLGLGLAISSIPIFRPQMTASARDKSASDSPASTGDKCRHCSSTISAGDALNPFTFSQLGCPHRHSPSPPARTSRTLRRRTDIHHSGVALGSLSPYPVVTSRLFIVN